MEQAIKIPSNVLIKNKEHFFDLLHIFKREGIQQLQILTDFDYTLSTFLQKDGSRNYSSHGILENCTLFSENYHKRTKELQSIYYPMEISTTLSPEEKKEKMDEWWNKAHELLIEEGVTEESIVNAVEHSHVCMREGSTELLSLCMKNKIPVLIFSAGLTDVLKTLFKNQLGIEVKKNSGIEIISNKMIFQNDKLVGFEDAPITSLTKNMRGKSYVHRLKDRRNLIVMGDNIGDLHMSQGMKFTNQLTVGFLNDHIEERKEQYLNSFDIVIVGDSDCHFINTILNYLIEPSLSTIEQESDNLQQDDQLPELG